MGLPPFFSIANVHCGGVQDTALTLNLCFSGLFGAVIGSTALSLLEITGATALFVAVGGAVTLLLVVDGAVVGMLLLDTTTSTLPGGCGFLGLELEESLLCDEGFLLLVSVSEVRSSDVRVSEFRPLRPFVFFGALLSLSSCCWIWLGSLRTIMGGSAGSSDGTKSSVACFSSADRRFCQTFG
jgi:hypothetical protein